MGGFYPTFTRHLKLRGEIWDLRLEILDKRVTGYRNEIL